MFLFRRRFKSVWFQSVLLVTLLYLCFRPSLDGASNFALWNLSQPPPCNSREIEFSRFNELLANAQYKCSKLVRLLLEHWQFPFCRDADANGQSFFMISFVGQNDDLTAERAVLLVKNKSWKLVVFGSNVQSDLVDERLTVHKKCVVPSSLRSAYQGDKYASLNEALDAVGPTEKVDLLKIDCTLCWNPQAQVDLINELVHHGLLRRVSTLMLVVHTQKPSRQLLYAWYRTLNAMFFDNSLAIYAAKQSGDCSSPDAHCKYTIGLINVSLANARAIVAPTAGLGSFDEEVLRIKRFFADQVACSERPLQATSETACYECEPWLLCNLDQQLSVVRLLFFGFRKGEMCTNAYHGFGDDRYDLCIIDPVCISKPGFSGNFHHSNLSLFEHDCHLIISTLPHDTFHIVLIDLRGGEWDLFGQLLSTNIVKRASQLLLRVHFWVGEEPSNVRWMFTQLYLLTTNGFSIFNTVWRREKCNATTSWQCHNREYVEIGLKKAYV